MNENQSFLNAGSRREFLKTSTAAMGVLLTSHLAVAARGQTPNRDQLKVGLVGCGGRGTGAANQALEADDNVILTAMGDAFSDQLHHSLNTLKRVVPNKVKVEGDHCFVGL